MDFQTFIPLALRTAKALPTKQDDFKHAALGLSTESGEFNTAVKNIYIYGASWDDFIKKTDKTWRQNGKEELADTCWYVPLALRALDLTALPVITANQLEQLIEKATTLEQTGLMLSALCGVIAAQAAFTEIGQDGGFSVSDMGQILAQIVWLIDHAAPMLDTTGDELRAYVIAKLRERFPDAYSDEAALSRADKNGLPALLS